MMKLPKIGWADSTACTVNYLWHPILAGFIAHDRPAWDIKSDGRVSKPPLPAIS